MKTFRTLFSGGELFGVGARAAGWQHVDGYEIRPDIALIAQCNGFDVRVADVCTVDYASLVTVDHIHASPSCKTASVANTYGGETDQDRAMAEAVCRAIRAHAGMTFSLENVWFYRHFISFDRICDTLRRCGFCYDFWHLNAADYGVPQTRKRLILIARRGEHTVSRPVPTHRCGGDMFQAPWVGWYSTIADLVSTLPPTQPAAWQIKRMPEYLKTTLIGANGWKGNIINRCGESPSFTLSFGGDPGSNGNAAQIRAYIIDSDNASHASGYPTIRGEAEPMFTISAGMSFPKTHIGRWVRLTTPALGRLQTVPDNYIGLTNEINGNGVPCLLAQRIMESVLLY